MKKLSLFSQLLILIIAFSLISSMEKEEEIDPLTIIEAAIRLCLLKSIILDHELRPIPSSNIELPFTEVMRCPVRAAGLSCICFNEYFKNAYSFRNHLKAISGAFRCASCKRIYSGKLNLENHRCDSKRQLKSSSSS
jgi:hypothetical protein